MEIKNKETEIQNTFPHPFPDSFHPRHLCPCYCCWSHLVPPVWQTAAQRLGSGCSGFSLLLLPPQLFPLPQHWSYMGHSHSGKYLLCHPSPPIPALALPCSLPSSSACQALLHFLKYFPRGVAVLAEGLGILWWVCWSCLVLAAYREHRRTKDSCIVLRCYL